MRRTIRLKATLRWEATRSQRTHITRRSVTANPLLLIRAGGGGALHGRRPRPCRKERETDFGARLSRPAGVRGTTLRTQAARKVLLARSGIACSNERLPGGTRL